MNKLGLKASLLISTLLLVALSVTTASVISYFEQKENLTDEIMQKSRVYVENRAALIESMLDEKVYAVDKLATEFANKSINTDPKDLIVRTDIIAKATNTDSAVIAFKNGVGYWNQTAPDWPNHKYVGDITTRPWFSEAMASREVVVTEPYLGTDNGYWVTVVKRILDGTISIDMQLKF